MQQSLRERREAVVRKHMASENRHDFDATIATFRYPHGKKEVRGHWDHDAIGARPNHA